MSQESQKNKPQCGQLFSGMYCFLKNQLWQPNHMSNRKNKGTFTFSTFNFTYWVQFLSCLEYILGLKIASKYKKPFLAIFASKVNFLSIFQNFQKTLHLLLQNVLQTAQKWHLVCKIKSWNSKSGLIFSITPKPQPQELISATFGVS